MYEMLISFAGNYDEKLMVGATVGVPFVNYRLEGEYNESDPGGGLDGNAQYFDNLTYTEYLRTEGIGVNLKLGVTYRISQALRIGGAFHTPTALRLTDTYSNTFAYTYEDGNGLSSSPVENSPDGTTDYRLRTPWRAIASAAVVIRKYGFLSADVEWVDYGANRYNLNADVPSTLKRLMHKEAIGRFGSGWVWLYVTPEKKLAVCSSPNQDNPLMDASGKNRGIPVLGIDVWEHAYYLKYQNKRGDYLSAIWNVIDWDTVESLYHAALTDPLLKAIEKDAWQELKDYHMVMAQTFHPMEEGNLGPIRSRSGELVAKATVLAASKVPASFQSPQITKAIKELVEGSAAVDKLVRKKSKDEKIVKSLTKLHDTFHVIQGLCSDEH